MKPITQKQYDEMFNRMTAEGVDTVTEELNEVLDYLGYYVKTPKPVTTYKGDTFAATVMSDGELRWTDYVANEWTEQLPTVWLAVLRLSELRMVVAQARNLSPLDQFIQLHG